MQKYQDLPVCHRMHGVVQSPERGAAGGAVSARRPAQGHYDSDDGESADLWRRWAARGADGCVTFSAWAITTSSFSSFRRLGKISITTCLPG